MYVEYQQLSLDKMQMEQAYKEQKTQKTKNLQN